MDASRKQNIVTNPSLVKKKKGNTLRVPVRSIESDSGVFGLSGSLQRRRRHLEVSSLVAWHGHRATGAWRPSAAKFKLNSPAINQLAYDLLLFSRR